MVGCTIAGHVLCQCVLSRNPLLSFGQPAVTVLMVLIFVRMFMASSVVCCLLHLTCRRVALFPLNLQRAIGHSVVIIAETGHAHTLTYTHTKQEHKLEISLGTSHCRQCLIALRGKRDSGKKTGADIPLLFFFSPSHVFNTLCFSFPFLTPCFSYSAHHFVSSISIIQCDCS